MPIRLSIKIKPHIFATDKNPYTTFIMKKNSLLTTLALMIASAMSGCSSDEPNINIKNPLLPDDDYDSRAFTEMMSPTTDLTLTRKNVKTYSKDDYTNGKWEEYDWRDYDGASIPGPNLMVVKNGKIYTSPVLFTSATGPTALSTAIYLLQRTGKIDENRTLLVSRDFSLTENSITVNGTTLHIKNLKGNKLWLSLVSDFYGGRTGNGGQHLYVMQYDQSGPFGDNTYKFDSVEDLYAWAIDLFRERFGESVNRNYYLTGVILDNPIFTAQMIEDELDAFLNGKTYGIN